MSSIVSLLRAVCAHQCHSARWGTKIPSARRCDAPADIPFASNCPENSVRSPSKNLASGNVLPFFVCRLTRMTVHERIHDKCVDIQNPRPLRDSGFTIASMPRKRGCQLERPAHSAAQCLRSDPDTTHRSHQDDVALDFLLRERRVPLEAVPARHANIGKRSSRRNRADTFFSGRRFAPQDQRLSGRRTPWPLIFSKPKLMI